MGLHGRQPALMVKGEAVTAIQDDVCIEDTFRLYLNEIPMAQIIASPDQLRELGAGFVVCEGLAEGVDGVVVSGNDIRVSAATRAAIDYELRSSGCIGVRGLPRVVESELKILRADVFRVIREIESDDWKQTGGVHCSVLFLDGQLVVRSSDIGRHNTVDKVVGFALLNGIDLSRCVIGCTGRQPAGMIGKVANAGVPIVATKAATTDAGMALAERSNVTLIGFARGERFTIYSHPERILGVGSK
jgi:FdhD protein